MGSFPETQIDQKNLVKLRCEDFRDLHESRKQTCVMGEFTEANKAQQNFAEI